MKKTKPIGLGKVGHLIRQRTEELDRLRIYVHAGILQLMMQDGKNIAGEDIDKANDDKDQQHIAGKEHEKEDIKEVHTQGQHQIYEETTVWGTKI
eukprot:14499205-Heterocapsa_arctica.AAC.1